MYVFTLRYKLEGVAIYANIFLGYRDGEFGYRLWNLEEKKVIRSCDIVFMEEKTIANRESQKRTTSSVSTHRDGLEETRAHPDRNRI